MDLFSAQLINGIMLGAIYGLVALGFTLLYSVVKVLQLAYGEVIMLSMYAAWQTFIWTNNNVFLGILAAIVVATGLSLLMERFAYRYLRRRESRHHEPFVLAIGFALLFSELASKLFRGGQSVGFSEVLRGGGGTIYIGSLAVYWSQVYSLLAMMALLGAFTFFLSRTKQGMSLRAVAVDWRIARMLGIQVDKAAAISWAVTGLLAGIIAMLFAFTLGAVSPALGSGLSFKGLAIILVAGLGSFPGAVVCGLALGVVEVMAQTYLGGSWRDAIAFGLIVAVILIRPKGVFGSQEA